MDLHRLLLDTDPTLATFAIVAVLAVLVMGSWELLKFLITKDRVVEVAAPRHQDMRTLTGVPLEAVS
jgi:hypothetical protein